MPAFAVSAKTPLPHPSLRDATLLILPQPPPFPRLRLRLVRRRRRRLPPLPPSRVPDRAVRARAFLPRFRRVDRSQRGAVDPLVDPSRVVVPAVSHEVLARAVVSRPAPRDRRVHRLLALRSSRARRVVSRRRREPRRASRRRVTHVQTNRLRADFKSIRLSRRFARARVATRRARALGDVGDRARRRADRGLGRGEHRATRTTRCDDVKI